LCLPRADHDDRRFLVRKLRVSTPYLTRGQQYLGTCDLLFDTRHLTYISQLLLKEWAQLSADLWDSEKALHQVFRPDHLNVESLGNTVPHLHFGLILRDKNDGRWGRPIWTAEGNEREQRCLPEQDYARMARQISRLLRS
jgi:diadenosine tetraphosphate (Ap4A) HIT family hydrolase